MNKQKTDWENIKSLLLCEKYIYYCDLNNEDLDKLSKFISQLLKTQRQQLCKKCQHDFNTGVIDFNWNEPNKKWITITNLKENKRI